MIELNSSEWTVKLAPLELVLENSNTGCEIVAQAGAIFFKVNSETKMTMDTSNGDIYCNTVYANELLYKVSDNQYYDVADQINALWQAISN